MAMLVVCKCGTSGGQFARKSTFSGLFSSDGEQYKIIM